eukprot:Pgem_evm2s601
MEKIKLQGDNMIKYYTTPNSGQIQLQIPLSIYSSTLISGQIPPTYPPLDVTYYLNAPYGKTKSNQT